MILCQIAVVPPSGIPLEIAIAPVLPGSLVYGRYLTAWHRSILLCDVTAHDTHTAQALTGDQILYQFHTTDESLQKMSTQINNLRVSEGRPYWSDLPLLRRNVGWFRLLSCAPSMFMSSVIIHSVGLTLFNASKSMDQQATARWGPLPDAGTNESSDVARLVAGGGLLFYDLVVAGGQWTEWRSSGYNIHTISRARLVVEKARSDWGVDLSPMEVALAAALYDYIIAWTNHGKHRRLGLDTPHFQMWIFCDLFPALISNSDAHSFVVGKDGLSLNISSTQPRMNSKAVLSTLAPVLVSVVNASVLSAFNQDLTDEFMKVAKPVRWGLTRIGKTERFFLQDIWRALFRWLTQTSTATARLTVEQLVEHVLRSMRTPTGDIGCTIQERAEEVAQAVLSVAESQELVEVHSDGFSHHRKRLELSMVGALQDPSFIMGAESAAQVYDAFGIHPGSHGACRLSPTNPGLMLELMKQELRINPIAMLSVSPDEKETDVREQTTTRWLVEASAQIRLFGNRVTFCWFYDWRGRIYSAGETFHPQASAGLRGCFEPLNVPPVRTEEQAKLAEELAAYKLGALITSRDLTREQVVTLGRDMLEKQNYEPVWDCRETAEHTNLLLAASSPLRNRLSRDLGVAIDTDRSLVSIDCTCSGFGVLGVLADDEAATFHTNITVREEPAKKQDVYTMVLADMKNRLDPKSAVLRALGLTKGTRHLMEGLTRKVGKGGVMIVPYGAGAKSIGLKILTEYGRSHDEAMYINAQMAVDGEGRSSTRTAVVRAATYLGNRLMASVKNLYPDLMSTKEWLDSIAVVASLAGTSLSWEVADGSSVVMRRTRSLRQKTVLPGVSLQVITEDVDPAKTELGFMPNLVHSIDAAVCGDVVREFLAEGHTIIPVHDCWLIRGENQAWLQQLFQASLVRNTVAVRASLHRLVTGWMHDDTITKAREHLMVSLELLDFTQEKHFTVPKELLKRYGDMPAARTRSLLVREHKYLESCVEHIQKFEELYDGVVDVPFSTLKNPDDRMWNTAPHMGIS